MKGYRELIRRKLLDEMFDKLSPEDKHALFQITLQDRDYEEIKHAIQTQDRKLDEIHKSQSWWYDLGANVAGNGIYDTALWILRKIWLR